MFQLCSFHFNSSVASNNAQVRCNLVDLYYSLFGSKTPNCLAKNELPLTSGLPKIPKIPKISDTKRSASPIDNGIVATKTVVNEPIEIEEKEAESISKPIEVNEEPTDSVKVIFALKISI